MSATVTTVNRWPVARVVRALVGVGRAEHTPMAAGYPVSFTAGQYRLSLIAWQRSAVGRKRYQVDFDLIFGRMARLYVGDDTDMAVECFRRYARVLGANYPAPLPMTNDLALLPLDIAAVFVVAETAGCDVRAAALQDDLVLVRCKPPPPDLSVIVRIARGIDTTPSDGAVIALLPTG